MIVCSVLSRTIYVNNVPANARPDELERLLTPLGSLIKWDKIGGAAGTGAAPHDDAATPAATFQTVEAVYETAEEADK